MGEGGVTELVITRGLPASGKTTWARGWANQPERVRLSRDDLRQQLFNVEGVGTSQREAAISDLYTPKLGATSTTASASS